MFLKLLFFSAAKLQTAVLEDQSIKPRATAVSESAPKTSFGTLPQKNTDTSKLKPEALTWEVGWKDDLTYHQIAVASKAAFKWLEYVDRRVTEREEIERSRIEHENSSKIKSKSDTKSEAMDSQKIDQQTPLKHPVYSPDSGKYSNKVKLDTSKSKKKQHKSHSSTSAEYYSSVVHTEEIYEETSYWVETTYSGTGELQLNQPDRKEHFKQREESSTWKRKQFMTVRGEDDDFETEDNEQLISGGQMDIHEVRLGSNAAAKWLDRVISRSIDETGEDGRTELETTTSETTETSFRRSELFSREISEESRSVNRYCGQLQIPPSDNKDNATWQSDTTGDENSSVEAEKGAETDIQKEKRAKPQRALVSIPSSESVVLHNPMRYFADTHSDKLGDSQCIAQAETDMYPKNQELNSIPEVSEDSFLVVRRPRYEIDLQIQASVKDSVEERDQNMVDERDLSSLLKIPVEGDTDVHNTMRETQLGSTAATKWVTSLLSRDDNVPDGSIAERTDRIESSRPKLGVKGAKLSDSNEDNLVSTTTTTNRQSEPVVTEESFILQRLTRYETELQQRETTVTPNENLSQEKTIGRSGNVETNDPARGTADHYTIREIKLGTTAATKWINKLLSKENYLQTEARDPLLNQIISSEPNDGNNRSSFDRRTYKFLDPQSYFTDTACEVPNEGNDNESNEDVLVSVAPTHNLQSEPEVSEESFLIQRRPRYEIELQQKETAATPIELMCPEKTIGRSGDVETNNPVTGTADHYTIREIKLGTTATTKWITNLLSKEGSLEPEAGDPQTNQFNLSEPFDGMKKDNFDRTTYKFHDPQRYFTDNASEVINEGTDNETNGEVLVSAAPTRILQSEPEVSEESFLIQRRPRYEIELQQKETAATPSELISQEKTIGRSGDVETNDPATGTADHYTIREIKLVTTATTKSITNLLSKEESLEPEARGLQTNQFNLSEPFDEIKKVNFARTTYKFHDPQRYFTDNASEVINEGTDNETNGEVLVSAAPTRILKSEPEVSEESFLIQRRPRYEIELQQKETAATPSELMSQEKTIGRSGDVETKDPATSTADHYTIREVKLGTTAATKWITNLLSKEGSLEPEAGDPQTNQFNLSEPFDGIKKDNFDRTTYKFHDPQRYFTDNASEVINEGTDNETNGEVLVSAAPTRILKSEPEVSEESFLIQRRPRYEIELQQKETAATPSELMSQEKTIGRSGDVETSDTATGRAGHYTIREIKLSTTAATKWITNLLSKEESLEPEARDLQTNQSILFEPTDGIKKDNFDRTTYNFHDPLRYFTNNASKVPNEGTDNETNEDILVSAAPTRTLQNEPEVSEESFLIRHRPRYEIELQEKETAATPIELMSQEKTIGRSGDVETNDSATGTADQYTIREIKFGTTAATKRITNLFSKEEFLEPDARDRQTNQSFLSEPNDGIKKDNVDVTNYNVPNPQRYFTDNASDVPNEGTDNETIDDSLVSVAPNLNLQSEPEVSEESFLIQRRPRYEIELQQKETAENTYKNLSRKETSGRSGDVETNDPATGTADHYTIREVKLGTTAATKWITNLLSKEDSLEPEKLDPQTNQSIFSEANDGINRNNFDRTNYSVHDPQRYFTDNASDVPNERSCNESNDDILVSDASASSLQSEPKVSEESLPIQRRPRYKIELQHNATAETPNENLSQEETVSCAGNVETKVSATGRADHYTIREMKLSTTAATKWTTKLLLKEEAVDLKPHSSNEYGFSESNDRSEHRNLIPDNSFLRSHSSKLEDLSQIGQKATHWNPATSADDKLGYSENFEPSIQANAPDQSAGLQSVPDDQESFFDNKALKSKTAVDNSNVRSVDGTEERKPNVKFSEKGTSSKPDEIAETLQPMPVAAEITATANLDSQVDSSYNLSTSFDDDASSMTGSFMSGSSYASSLADGSPAFLDPDFELKMTGALQSIADKFKRKKARRRPKGESKRDLQGTSVSNSKVVQRDSTMGSQREPTIPMISSDRKLESIPDEEFSLEIPKIDGDIEETGQNVDKYMTSHHQQRQKNLSSTTRDLSQQILDPFKSSQENIVSVVTTKQQPQNNPSSGDKEKVLDENSEQRKTPGSVERPRKDTVNKKESSLIAAEDIPSSKVGVVSSGPHEPKDTNSVNTSKWSIRELELGANTASKWVDNLLSKGSEKESAEITVAEMSSTGHVTATRIDVLIRGDERYQNQATGISKKMTEKENDQPIDTKFPNETDEQTMQFQFSNLTTPVSVVFKSDKDKPDDSNTFPFKRTNPQSTLKDDSQREPADIDRDLPKDYMNLTRSNNPVEVSSTSDRGSNSRPQDENNLAMEQVEPNKLPKDTETERFTAKLTPTLHSEPGTLFLCKDSLEKDTRDTYYLDTKDNITQKLDSTSPKTKSEDISENTKKAASVGTNQLDDTTSNLDHWSIREIEVGANTAVRWLGKLMHKDSSDQSSSAQPTEERMAKTLLGEPDKTTGNPDDYSETDQKPYEVFPTGFGRSDERSDVDRHGESIHLPHIEENQVSDPVKHSISDVAKVDHPALLPVLGPDPAPKVKDSVGMISIPDKSNEIDLGANKEKEDANRLTVIETDEPASESSSVLHSEPSNVFQLDCSKDKDQHEAASPGAIQDNEPSNVLEKQPSETDSDQIAGSQQPFADVFEHKGDKKQTADEAEDETRKEQDENSKISAANDGITHRPPHSEPLSITVVPPNDRNCEPYLESLTSPTFDDDASSVTGSFISGSSYASSLADGTAPTFDPDFELKMTGALQKIADKYKRKKTRRRPKGESKRDKLNQEPENSEPKPPIEKIPEESTPHSEHTNSELGIIAPDVSTESKLESKPNTEFDLELPACDIPGDFKEPSHKAESDDKIGVDANKKPNQSMAQIDARIRNIPGADKFEGNKRDPKDDHKSLLGVRDVKLGSMAAGKWLDKLLSKDSEEPPENKAVDQKTPITASDNTKTANRSLYEPTEVIDNLSTDFNQKANIEHSTRTSSVSEDKLIRPPEESEGLRNEELVRKPGDNEDERYSRSANHDVSAVHEAAGQPPPDNESGSQEIVIEKFLNYTPKMNQGKSIEEIEPTTILNPEVPDSDQTQQQPLVAELNSEVISLNPIAQTRLESTPDMGLDIDGSIKNQGTGDEPEIGITRTDSEGKLDPAAASDISNTSEPEKLNQPNESTMSVREVRYASMDASKWIDNLLSKDASPNLSSCAENRDNNQSDLNETSSESPPPCVVLDENQRKSEDDCVTEPHGEDCIGKFPISTPRETLQISENITTALHGEKSEEPNKNATKLTFIHKEGQLSGDRLLNVQFDDREVSENEKKSSGGAERPFSVREFKLGSTAAGKWIDNLLYKDIDEANVIDLRPDQKRFEKNKTDQLTAEYKSDSVPNETPSRLEMAGESSCDYTTQTPDLVTYEVPGIKVPHLNEEKSAEGSKLTSYLRPDVATADRSQHRTFVAESNQENISLDPAAQTKLESTPDMGPNIDISIGNQEVGDESETGKPDTYQTEDDKFESLDTTKGQLSVRELKLGSTAAGKWVDKLLSKDFEEPNKIELTPDEEDLEQSKTDQLTDYEAQSDRGDSVTRPVSTVEPPRDKGTAISDAITPAVHGDKKPHLSQEESGNESKPTIPLQPEAAISDQIQQRSFVSESNTESFWLDPAAPTELERSGIPDTYENEDDKIESLDATKAQFSVRELKLGSTAAGKWVDTFLSKDCEQPNKIEWTPEQECLEQSKTDQLTDYESQSVRGDSVNRPVSTVEPPRDQSTAILDAATPAVHVDEKPHLSQEESGNKSKRTVILQSEAAISDQTQQRPFVSESNQESISLDPAVQTKLESTPDLVLDIEIGNQKSGDDSETGKTDTYETEDDKMESLDATQGQLSVRELKLGSNAAGKWVDKLLSKDCEEPYKIELTPDEEGLKLSETDQMTDNESQSVRGDSVNRPVSTVEPTRDQSMVISDYATPAFHVDKKPHLSKEESGNELKSTATLQPEAATSHQTQQRPFVSEPNQESILLDPAAQNKLESTPDTVLDIDTSIGNQESGDEPETRKPDTYETEDDKMKTLEATKGQLSVRELKLGTTAAGKWVDKLLSKDCEEPNKIELTPDEEDLEQSKTDQLTEYESQSVRGVSVYRPVSTVEPPRDQSMAILDAANPAVDIDKKPNLSQEESGNESKPRVTLQPEAATSHQTQQRPFVSEPNQESILLHPAAQNKLESTPDMVLDIDTSIGNQESGDEPETRKPDSYETDDDKMKSLEATKGQLSIRELKLGSNAAGKWVDKLLSKDCEEPYKIESRPDEDGLKQSETDQLTEYESQSVRGDSVKRPVLIVEPPRDQSMAILDAANPAVDIDKKPNLSQEESGNESKPRVTLQPEAATSHQTQQRPFVSEPNQESILLDPAAQNKLESTPDMVLDIDTSIGNQESGDEPETRKPDTYETEDDKMKTLEAKKGQLSVRELKLGSTAAGKWVDKLLSKDCEEPNKIELTPDEEDLEQSKTDQLTEYESQSVRGVSVYRPVSTVEPPRDQSTAISDAATPAVDINKKPNLSQEERGNESKQGVIWQPESLTSNQTQQQPFVSEPNQESISLDPAAQNKLESTPDMVLDIETSIGNQENGDEPETRKPDTYETEDDKMKSLEATKGQLSIRELKLGSNAVGKWVDKLLSKDCEEPNKIESTPDEEGLKQSDTDQVKEYESESVRGDSVNRPVSTVEPPRDQSMAILDAANPAVDIDKKPNLSQEESGNESKPRVTLQPEAATSHQTQQRPFVSEPNQESILLDPAAQNKLESTPDMVLDIDTSIGNQESGDEPETRKPDTYETEDDKMKTLEAKKGQLSVRELKLGSTAAGKWVDKLLSKDCEEPNKIELTPDEEDLEQSKTDQLTEYESQSVRGVSVYRPVSTVEPPRDQSTAISDAATPAVDINKKPNLSQEERGNESKQRVIWQPESLTSNQTQQQPFVSEPNQESISLDPAAQNKLESTPDMVLDIDTSIGNQENGDEPETRKPDTYETEDDKMKSLEATKGQLSIRELKLGSNAVGKWVDKLLSKDCEEPNKIESMPDEEGLKQSDTDQVKEYESESVRGDSVNRPVSTVEPPRDQSTAISDAATPAVDIDRKRNLSQAESGNESKQRLTLQPEAAISDQTQQRPFFSESNQETISLDPAAQTKLESTPDLVLDIDISIGSQEIENEPGTRKTDTYESEDDKIEFLDATKGQFSVRELKLGSTAAGKWVDKLLFKDCEQPNKIELAPDEEDLELRKTDPLKDYESQRIPDETINQSESTVESPRDMTTAPPDVVTHAVLDDEILKLKQGETEDESMPVSNLLPQSSTHYSSSTRETATTTKGDTVIIVPDPGAQFNLESIPDTFSLISGGDQPGSRPKNPAGNKNQKPTKNDIPQLISKPTIVDERGKGVLNLRDAKFASKGAAKWIDKLLSKEDDKPPNLPISDGNQKETQSQKPLECEVPKETRSKDKYNVPSSKSNVSIDNIQKPDKENDTSKLPIDKSVTVVPGSEDSEGKQLSMPDNKNEKPLSLIDDTNKSGIQFSFGLPSFGLNQKDYQMHVHDGNVVSVRTPNAGEIQLPSDISNAKVDDTRLDKLPIDKTVAVTPGSEDSQGKQAGKQAGKPSGENHGTKSGMYFGFNPPSLSLSQKEKQSSNVPEEALDKEKAQIPTETSNLLSDELKKSEQNNDERPEPNEELNVNLSKISDKNVAARIHSVSPDHQIIDRERVKKNDVGKSLDDESKLDSDSLAVDSRGLPFGKASAEIEIKIETGVITEAEPEVDAPKLSEKQDKKTFGSLFPLFGRSKPKDAEVDKEMASKPSSVQPRDSKQDEDLQVLVDDNKSVNSNESDVRIDMPEWDTSRDPLLPNKEGGDRCHLFSEEERKQMGTLPDTKKS